MIVSTSPDSSPVIKIRKLPPHVSVVAYPTVFCHLQSDPAITRLFLEDTTEPLNELSGQLLLPQIRPRLDNDRDYLDRDVSPHSHNLTHTTHVPIDQVTPRRGCPDPGLLRDPGLFEHSS